MLAYPSREGIVMARPRPDRYARLRQIEALLVSHQDAKQKKTKTAMKAATPKATKTASRQAS